MEQITPLSVPGSQQSTTPSPNSLSGVRTPQIWQAKFISRRVSQIPKSRPRRAGITQVSSSATQNGPSATLKSSTKPHPVVWLVIRIAQLSGMAPRFQAATHFDLRLGHITIYHLGCEPGKLPATEDASMIRFAMGGFVFLEKFEHSEESRTGAFILATCLVGRMPPYCVFRAVI